MTEETKRETRRCDRMGLRLPLALRVKSVEHRALTVDFSPLGVGILADISLRPGATVGILPREGTQGAVPARVVWVETEESEGERQVGLEFLNPLPAPV
jgi:hypothetical protein